MFRKFRYIKSIIASALVMIVIYIAIPMSTNLVIVNATEIVNEIDRSKLATLFITVIALTDIPVDQVEKYELFNTLYIYRNSSMIHINEPYLSGDLVLNLTANARAIRELVKNNATIIENETGVYVSIPNEFSIGVEVVNENSSWDLLLKPIYNKTLNNNTIMYWRDVLANMSNHVVNYKLMYLVQNVSKTHRIYIATLGEISYSNNSYNYVVTLAIYWFKDKTIFFGDWIVLPEGADNLKQYFELIAKGVKWLSANVYNGGSPGYHRKGNSSNYSPTAYPQIAKALELLTNNIPEDYNLLVEKGYALILDGLLGIISAICVTLVVIGAILTYVAFYIEDRDLAAKLGLAAYIIGTIGSICIGYVITKIIIPPPPPPSEPPPYIMITIIIMRNHILMY